MHTLWSIYLFIYILFSLLLFNKAHPGFFNEDEYEDDNEKIIFGETETTTPVITKHTHRVHFNDGTVYYSENDDKEYDIYDDHVDDHSSMIIPIFTKTSSTLKTEVYIYTTTEKTTTTTTTEKPFTNPVWSYYTRTMSTIDTKQIAEYIATTNRNRLLLKIFAIITIVGMVGLAVIFIIIHLIQKKRRYTDYRLPTNQSLNKK
ncbi:unnamed protein product [Adineta steineri]|uniref:Uncharacterized protein n=1 Tax=Adineta steineri TaxID=433720 RepID=A0A813VLZ3_9BILA|nr:unnamed protein product [Adineta steineri]CAF3644793.1 unnamed protein product [Adineta steineri]